MTLHTVLVVIAVILFLAAALVLGTSASVLGLSAGTLVALGLASLAASHLP